MNFDFFVVITNLNVMFFNVDAADAAATFAVWHATKAGTCHNDGKYQERQNGHGVKIQKKIPSTGINQA